LEKISDFLEKKKIAKIWKNSNFLKKKKKKKKVKICNFKKKKILKKKKIWKKSANLRIF
jgi:hypothetical protein